MSQTSGQIGTIGGLQEGSGGYQYLTFICAGAEYGIDILRVQEIKGWAGVTRVPHTPEYVLGIMNLRGIIAPVLDLRARLDLGTRSFDASTVVIVVRIEGSRGHRMVGVVVDAVSDVYTFAPEAVRPPPDFGALAGDSCLSGLVTVDDRMVMIVDIDRLVSGETSFAD